MNTLTTTLKAIRKAYDKGTCTQEAILNLSIYCIEKLARDAQSIFRGESFGKRYHVFSSGGEISRPYLEALYISDPADFRRRWNVMVESITPATQTITTPAEEINKVLYTSVMSLSACFDLWRRASRKTPGTFLEVLLGTILGLILTESSRTKHIPLVEDTIGTAVAAVAEGAEVAEAAEEVEAEGEADTDSVSTDIVFTKEVEGVLRGLVIPAKISTRERIVQPFAHQRILNSFFGEGRFISIVMCVSETQIDGPNESVRDTCVPKTIKLFQLHLAEMGGIYYLDPPPRYLQDDLTRHIPVGTIGEFLTGRLPTLF